MSNTYHKNDNAVDVFPFVKPVIPDEDRARVLELISYQPDREFLADVLGLNHTEDEPQVTFRKKAQPQPKRERRDYGTSFCRIHEVEMRQRVDPDNRRHGFRCSKCESETRRRRRAKLAGKDE